MSWPLACAGWAVAAALVCSLRRRLALVADAEHELRGAATAIGLAAERMSRAEPFAAVVRLQADRMTAGLADLAAARSRRAAPPEQPHLEAGRLAQVLGNLVANAAEHGVGPVDVRATGPRGAIRLEIRNGNRPPELDAGARPAGRGRGLAIAVRAARELGGELRVEVGGNETVAELELPAPGGRTGAGLQAGGGAARAA